MAVYEFSEHVVDIFRKSTLGSDYWCGRCSCGWLAYGKHADVANAAATHDMVKSDGRPQYIIPAE